MTDWDQRFLDMAEHIANWSKDPNTKVGAVIVEGKNDFVSLGYNGFPRGVYDWDDRYENRARKMLFVAHAERNALDAARGSVKGCTMYSPLLPCVECAKSIIQKGIKRVVSYTPNRPDVFNWNITKLMFQEADVELVMVERKQNV